MATALAPGEAGLVTTAWSPGRPFSAALGMAAGRDKKGTDENVFGDAALTNGISFETLNNISHTTKRFIGILNNDNEWSIAKNVGADFRVI